MYEKIWNQNKIAFGGDYNPEQWDEATWEEDMHLFGLCLLYTSPSPRDRQKSRMPSSA